MQNTQEKRRCSVSKVWVVSECSVFLIHMKLYVINIKEFGKMFKIHSIFPKLRKTVNFNKKKLCFTLCPSKLCNIRSKEARKSYVFIILVSSSKLHSIYEIRVIKREKDKFQKLQLGSVIFVENSGRLNIFFIVQSDCIEIWSQLCHTQFV